MHHPIWAIMLAGSILSAVCHAEPAAAGPCGEDAAAVARNISTDGVERAQGMLPQRGNMEGLPPLAEMITSRFGPRRMPGWLSRRGMVIRSHSGLDIRAMLGWPVIAFKGGLVSHAGPLGLSGIVVEIRQNDGMTARYAHLEKALVSKGRRVEAGAEVGLVGCTGRTTGAHLHFGLQNAQGELVDPLPYLSSAGQLLRPAPGQIPAVLVPQQCGPVIRGRDGKPKRMGNALKDIDNYTPPPIPRWEERP